MKFRNIFLMAAWVIFFALNKSIPACVIMICAGIYSIVDAIPELKRNGS